jgi:hypothetical protein
MLKFLILISISLGAVAKSYVNKTETLNEKGTEFGINTSFFVPTQFSNFNGEVEDFEENEAYFRTDLLVDFKYGFTDQLQTSIGTNFRLVQARGTFDDEEKTLVASGLESISVQLKYSFLTVNRLQYSFEVNYRNATYDNEYFEVNEVPEVPESTAIGEGSTELSVGGGFTFMTEDQNFFSGRILYRNPGDKLSSEIFSEVEVAFAWEYFTALFGVENIYSLNQDAFSDDPENKPVLSRASSPEYNSINRSWTAPYFGINIGIGSMWRVEFKTVSKISGASTTLGNEFFLNFVRRNSKSKTFARKDAEFKEYQYEGSITKVSKSKRAVSVDMGLETGVGKGSKVDFYFFDYLEGNQLIASGYVVKVGASKSIVKITKKFSKQKLKPGIVARAGLIRD